MDEFKAALNYIFKKIKLYIFKFYNRLSFIFNKQITLQKIYEPIITDKHKKAEELKSILTYIKKENEATNKKLLNLSKENIILKSKICLLQDLLLKK
ncbi:hypothetical protein JK636_21955 [Clostridium sp. YIM B02515]|uniref:Transposase n=1 Tax=Clostridium rhizosphaerae TaxID=2803861 RepID=A0ABS1TH10_9CLOT|nr:hypothetical protein [Clostridium rhizosphaerae]MBL4938382.1 hypothetical protein [Clostridium rhizosphaerae]